jgi:hypothetical protein
MALRACYLCCARVSEIVGENYGSQNLARGPRGIDAKDVYWESGPVKEKALVIDIHTAKRSGLLRRLGLAPDYDSWVLPMGQYFWSKGESVVFPFTRQELSEYVESNQVFEGLEWPVDKYTLWSGGKVERKVEGHLKPFTIHSLRHLRATTLTMDYGFDAWDLAIHGGWTVNVIAAGITEMMARYQKIYERWDRPFPKLLRPLPLVQA